MNKLTLRCVVLEDEEEIRQWLVKRLKEYPELEIVGESATIDDAFRLIASTQPDVAFMDIQLIGGDAFTLLSRLQRQGLPIPYIVMATGYPEYVMTALNEYRHYVVQYLVKPFVENWKEKFRKAIDALMAARAGDLEKRQGAPTSGPEEPEQEEFTFLQSKGNLLRLDFDKIAYLEAAGGGESLVVTDDTVHQVDLTLNKFLDVLSPNFIRISRANIINTDRVVRINRGDRTVEVQCKAKNKSLGVSDTYYQELLQSLPLAKEKRAASPANTKKELAGDHPKTNRRQNAKQHDFATIMVANLLNFTEANKGLSPESLVSELANCFQAFDRLVKKQGGEKIKNIGGTYRCAAGLSGKDKTHSVASVVKAAQELLTYIQSLNAKRKKQGQLPLTIRIGIHSGPVIAHQTGNDQTPAYELIGDTVKIAGLVEQNGKPDQISISDTSWKAVRKEFDCRFLGAFSYTSGEEVEVYVVNG